jgi:Tol biopolymer transport system component
MVYSTNRYWPGWDIMLYSSVSGKSKLLTSGVRSYCRASWSPDGSMLVYSYGAGKEIDLWLQNKGTAFSSQLTDFPGREYDAVWVEGGEGVFYAGELDPGSTRYGAFYIDIKSKAVTPVLAGPGSIRHLSWTPLPEIPPIPLPPKDSEPKSDKISSNDS